MTEWAPILCGIASTWRFGNATILALFQQAAPPLHDEEQFLAVVLEELRKRPELVDQWLRYSLDKRSVPSPYLLDPKRPRGDNMEVGIYDIGGAYDVVRYTDGSAACTDFLDPEATWVLRGE